jgi:hypothetical protein
MTQREPPSAAAALYPHLRQGTPNEVEQRRAPNSIGDAMWPSLSPSAKAHDAAQAQQQRRKQQFIADLRELTEQIRRSR